MNKELFRETHNLFDTPEKWNAFVELSNFRGEIEFKWLANATQKVRKHFLDHPPEYWTFESWDNDVDTRWHLSEFGRSSLAVGFGWNYQFLLHLIDFEKFDSELITENLRTEKFSPILRCFDRIDRQFETNAKALEYQNFHFGSTNDGRIPVSELAWYAAHETDQFVAQAIEKVERFTNDSMITGLMRELNEVSLRGLDGNS